MVEAQQRKATRLKVPTSRSNGRAAAVALFLSGMVIGGGVVQIRSSRHEQRLSAKIEEARAETESFRQLVRDDVANAKSRNNISDDELARLSLPWSDCPRHPPSSQPIVKFEARVVRYDATANVVQIDRGSDTGAFIGQKLDIVHGENFVGEMELDNVAKDYAIGHIGRVKVPGREPRVGDLATNL